MVVSPPVARIGQLPFQDTSGRKLTVSIPIRTHITDPFPQPIPSAHMAPLRNEHPHEPFHIPPRVVVYSSPHFSLHQ